MQIDDRYVFRPVSAFFPSKRKRWAAEQCARGRLPGAVRVGREWQIRRCDVEAYLLGVPEGGAAPAEADPHDVEATLAANGVK